MSRKPMFPDKAAMVRAANRLWLILVVAPALYLGLAFLVMEGGPGLEPTPRFILTLFITLLIVSAADVGLAVYFQSSKRLTRARLKTDPVGGTFIMMALGAVLSEAPSIYGLILTLLSGSISYGAEFSTITWASLIWVWGRFRQNLGKLPDPQPDSTS